MVEYAEVETSRRLVRIPLIVTNFGRPYQELFDKAVSSGFEAWLAYSHNNFDNPFQKADEALYKNMGWFAEIFHDIVKGRKREIGEAPLEDFVPVTYIANAGTIYEAKVNGWFPRNGLILPVKDERKGILWFVDHTLIPLETVPFDQRSKVEQRYSELDLPKDQISGFYRPDEYDNYRLVGRAFDPGDRGLGRFRVDAGWLPDYSGGGGVGSRSADEKKKNIVMEVSERKPAEVTEKSSI